MTLKSDDTAGLRSCEGVNLTVGFEVMSQESQAQSKRRQSLIAGRPVRINGKFESPQAACWHIIAKNLAESPLATPQSALATGSRVGSLATTVKNLALIVSFLAQSAFVRGMAKNRDQPCR